MAIPYESDSSDKSKSAVSGDSAGITHAAQEAYRAPVKPGASSTSGAGGDSTPHTPQAKVLPDGSISFGSPADYSLPVGVDPAHPFSVGQITQAGSNDAQILSTYAAHLFDKIADNGGGAGSSGGGGSNSKGGAATDGGGAIPAAESPFPGSDDSRYWVGTPSQTRLTESVFAQSGAAAGIDQGGLKDCSFESALTSLALSKNGPEAIAGMITQTPDQVKTGSYTVTFPGDSNNPVNVTQADITKYGLTNSAQWANVIEAAAANLKGGAINGISSQDAQALLTGTRPSSFGATYANGNSFANEKGDISQQYSQAYLTSEIATTLQNGGLVEAGTAANAKGVVSSSTEVHDYSVIHYDAKTGMVTLRNPWGNTNLQPSGGDVGTTEYGVTNLGGGEIRMSMSTFMNDFSTMSVSNPVPQGGEAQEASATTH